MLNLHPVIIHYLEIELLQPKLLEQDLLVPLNLDLKLERLTINFTIPRKNGKMNPDSIVTKEEGFRENKVFR